MLLPLPNFLDINGDLPHEISGGGLLLIEKREVILWKNIPQKKLKKSGMVYLIPLVEKVRRCPTSRIPGDIDVLLLEYLRFFLVLFRLALDILTINLLTKERYKITQKRYHWN